MRHFKVGRPFELNSSESQSTFKDIVRFKLICHCREYEIKYSRTDLSRNKRFNVGMLISTRMDVMVQRSGSKLAAVKNGKTPNFTSMVPMVNVVCINNNQKSSVGF